MKTWTEYASCIEDYYEWISGNANGFEKMSVLSFNRSGIAASNIDEFYNSNFAFE